MAKLDHLVIMATTLEKGVAWCETTFGVTPPPEAGTPLIGTHNRLLHMGGVAFPNAYLEIFYINLIANYLYRTWENR